MKRFLPALIVFAVLAGGCAEPEPKKNDDKQAKEGPPVTSDGKNPVVVMKVKDRGTVRIELFAKEAPITVKNFLRYVDEKHYDGTIFHRVISDFMIQGGNFTEGFTKLTNPRDLEKFKKQTHAEIKNEAKNGVSNKRGTLAMARTDDPDSATDQFFINVEDNTNKLDPGKFSEDGYAVFGKVIEGMEVVDKIKMVKTKRMFGGAMKDVPAEEVVIESIRREESK